MLSNKYFNSVILICVYLFLSACGLRVPPKFDPITQRYKTTVVVKRENIIIEKPVNLKKYKMLLVKVPGYMPAHPEVDDLLDALQRTHISKNILSIYKLTSYFSSNGINDSDVIQLTQTRYGLKKLNKIYGRFLILDISHYYENIFFKIYDPYNDEVFFSAHYERGMYWPTLHNPMLNELTDWVKRNKQY